ncbi:MAG TPA: chemotaxis protein CheB [Geopsychrobacteraceae bacterium]|nr:chemotaxis protein CheB [Geopsychrobacteraceae bacterium]
MTKQTKSTRSRAKAADVEAPTAEAPKLKEHNSFPIIGIGSSAGGLEALELFLGNVPPKNGMAFVIVQHLDPHHKGMMVELLQRMTDIPVVEIKDRMNVKAEHVYLIPPNKDLSILNGRLQLLEPSAPHGLRLPIDFFFHALAADQQNLCCAVILSGMGSDGVQGLRTIKEKSGGIFVQEPDSAKFDGMPRSAVDSGLADAVAAAEDLPAKIIAYLQSTRQISTPVDVDLGGKEQSGLEKVIALLRTQTGHDFSFYKKNTMYRRIERRMGLHHLPRIDDYVRYLRENHQEATLLFKELLIGVTSFFRDPQVWEQLKQDVMPDMLAARPDGGVLRAWVPGCSTGEEAYSLAILFREVLYQLKPAVNYSLQIFATDLDKEAIDKARTGSYPANILADISEERMQRFFVQDELGYRVKQEIREMVVFASQNLIMDPPFTKLDLLSCRNLLIYLQADLQKKVMRLFHYSLNPGGILLLGSSESVGQTNELFAPLSGKTRLYRRQNNSRRVDLDGFTVPYTRSSSVQERGDQPHSPAPNLQTLTDTLLLRHYTPAAVLTTDKGDILYITGKTGHYLEPAVGKANLNLFAMAREGLNSLLLEAFHKALRQKEIVTLKEVRMDLNGETQLVDVSVQPVTEPVALQGMVLIVFTNMAKPPAVNISGNSKPENTDNRLAALSLELKQSHQELRTTREEMQSSQEELRSANEELQSTNEELQSTNEELTTSKEEMQSMNEELQTVNQELQAKVDELSLASDDLKNLLNSNEIATLFLDESLKVRRFTPQTTSIIKLIPGDAGRPITDIVSKLDYPDLNGAALKVLRTLVPHERQVTASDGRCFSVNIMPYRTQNNRIDGVVITFVDMTQVKKQENLLSEALAALTDRFEQQAEELDKSQRLEMAAQKAQAVLEQLVHKKEPKEEKTSKDS